MSLEACTFAGDERELILPVQQPHPRVPHRRRQQHGDRLCVFLLVATFWSLADDLFSTDVQANGFVNPDEIELNDGDLSGLTLAPGLYKWSSDRKSVV